MARVDGYGLLVLGGGSLFVYAGVKGFSIPHTLQAIVSGKSPAKQTQTTPIDQPVSIPGSSTSGGQVGPGSASGQAIAADALRYVGTGYVYGGKADRPGDWDCSSFMSYVLGHDFGLTLPGGGHYGSAGYPPNSHGPVTTGFLSLGSAVPYGQQQAGDLLIWEPHCAFAISATQMVSAQDQQLGTGVSSIASAVSYFGAQPQVRRL